ncbi:hypothetical protein [Mycobacterium colombiense]|uniref:hypothetical protein n=1 Tax=Mycobacterium colombiense TaxID=339268 RepID=UPI0012DB5B79|nr:hypothetical protein [Mycobacterium colombiense]
MLDNDPKRAKRCQRIGLARNGFRGYPRPALFGGFEGNVRYAVVSAGLEPCSAVNRSPLVNFHNSN